MRKTITAGILWMSLLSLVSLSALSPDRNLLFCAFMGDSEGVELSLRSGADIEARTETGWTALIRAANQGHTGVVRTLLEYGADINARTAVGTALDVAVWNGHTECVKVLLQYGISTGYSHEEIWHPLMVAALFGYDDIIELLLDAGIPVDTPDRIAGWGLADSQDNTNDYQESSDNSDTVNGMSSNTAYSDKWKKPPYPELIDLPTDVLTMNLSGASPLLWAVQGGHVKTAELLLNRGADINYVDNFGYYAMWNAVVCGYTEIVRLLLDNGAVYSPEGSDFYLVIPSLVSLAREKGFNDIAELLIAAGGWE